MILSRYHKSWSCPEQPGKSLLYSTKRSAALLIDDSLLAAARQGSLPEKERDTLARLGLLVEDPDIEREQMRDIFLNARKQRSRFSALVVLNLDCNLACSYCYEDRFRGRHYMTQETAGLVVEAMRERLAVGKDVTISFYGGEALLSTRLIREISVPLLQAAKEYGKSYRFSLVTNGTLLTRKVAEELVPLGLSAAKITLDGPRELHDQSRPFVSGRGSFDAIMANMKEVWDLVPLRLGGNYTRDNYREFPRLFAALEAQGITPEKLQRVTFTPVVSKAGETRGVAEIAGECVCGAEQWLGEAALYLREETLKRGYPAAKPRMSACVVEYDDLVINYDGSLYKCPAFMGYEHLKIGALGQGITDYRVSHGMELWKKDECLDCPYLPLCFGGCRFMTLLRNGAIDDVSCKREYLDATLETIVRQDLQYQRGKA